MMIGYIVYDATSGVIARVGTCEPDDLPLQCRAGELVIEGDPAALPDGLSRAVDVETLDVIDYIPPAPDATDDATWAWDTETLRWVSTPTLAALKRDATIAVQVQIEGVERAQVRPTSAIVLALLASEEPDAGDITQLTALEGDKVELRDLRAAIEDAETVEELESLLGT